MVLDPRSSVRLVAALSWGCILVACGGNKPTGGPDPVPTPAIGTRLAWSQSASSAQQLQSLTYRLYVDRTLSSLSAVSCDTRGNGGMFECSGQLPSNISGTRVLELSAVLNGTEGPRSAPLTVRIGAATAPDSSAGQ